MSHSYFTQEDKLFLMQGGDKPTGGGAPDTANRDVAVKLMRLNEAILRGNKRHSRDIYAARPVLRTQSASIDGDEVAVGGVLHYLRSSGQALTVERLMGREDIRDVHQVESRRHPVFEVRPMANQLAIELIVSPDAWWDQQNFVGRLTFPQYRTLCYEFLEGLDGRMCLGFWRGTYLSDMHLKASQFKHRVILDEFLSTFEPGKDWLRLGMWYDLEDEALYEQTISETVNGFMQQLYPLYTFLLWTGDNNYRNFYLSSLSSS